MFKNLFKRPKPKPVFDPALGDALGQKILAEAQIGRTDILHEKVDAMRDGKWDQRMFYLDMASEYMPSRYTVDQLPDTAVGNMIRGMHATHWAWQARGSSTADRVEEEQWPVFFQRLELAIQNLMRAAEQAPDDPTPYAALLTVGMGLQLERSVLEEWFAEATKRDPLNQQAHYRMLFNLCKKWHGSHDDMYDFARQTVRKAPRGSTLQSVIYLAFQEHFLYLAGFDRNKVAAKALVRDSNIYQESMDVYKNSLGLRKQIENPADYWPHNVAAWWFLMLDKLPIVRQEVAKIGVSFTEYPWSIFYRDPADGYHKALNA